MTTHVASMHSASALRSRGIGIFACAAFGAFWATTALSAWPVISVVIGHALIVLMTGSLLIVAAAMIRRGRRPASSGDMPSSAQRRVGRVFGAIFAAEIIAMNIVAYLLVGHHLTAYLMPAIAIVVGLHFYPLAPLFRAPQYHVTATAMTLAGVIGIVLLATGLTANPVNAMVDIVCAITLWVTGFASWQSIRRVCE
jgi:hypothetical protein